MHLDTDHLTTETISSEALRKKIRELEEIPVFAGHLKTKTFNFVHFIIIDYDNFGFLHLCQSQ